MRRWPPIALIALAIGWFIVTNIGNAMAMGDLAGRPIVALTRETTRIPVQSPGMLPETGEARILDGTEAPRCRPFVCRIEVAGTS